MASVSGAYLKKNQWISLTLINHIVLYTKYNYCWIIMQGWIKCWYDIDLVRNKLITFIQQTPQVITEHYVHVHRSKNRLNVYSNCQLSFI